MKPQTRRSGLLIRELPDEMLVYDQERHRAHCLNRTAAAVFRLADGTRSVDDLAHALDPAAESPDAAAAVTLALGQLSESGLLECQPPEESTAGLTRRDVARRFGIAAAILLPAVVTMLAPTPAEAAATCVTSCVGQPNGTPCTCTGTPPCIDVCQTGTCAGMC
jgi:ferric-dicitrate binding protein FerR (iron transport regulator)